MKKSKQLVSNIEKNDRLASVICALESVKNNKFVTSSELFYEDFGRIIERLKDKSFRLAVVGEFSSGKSTFLNALIGKDILKHGAQETTATITEIHNAPLQETATSLDVYYSNGELEKNISVDDINEYTSTSSKLHTVAKEIERVVINSRILDAETPVCFIDTPGLNGNADNHREKTIEQVKNAHACIYLIQVRGLGQSDIEFLRYICKYQHNIIFVQNFIDELKRLEGETPEEKIREQRRIIEEKVLAGIDDVKYRIVATSSRKALFSRATDFTVYNEESLTEDLREKLYKESRFGDVLEEISSLMQENEREKIQQMDAISVALNLIEQLKNIVLFQNTQEKEAWNDSVEGRKSRNYEKIIESLKENKEAYKGRLDDYIESETADIRKECTRRITKGITSVEEKLQDVINLISSVEELETYASQLMPNFLYSQISEAEGEFNHFMNVRFENLISNAVLRIKQYTGSSAAEIKMDDITIQAPTVENEYGNFEKEENEILQIQKKIVEKKRIKERVHREEQKTMQEIDRIGNAIANYRDTLSSYESSRESEINRLGEIPEKEKRYRSETYTEYRGGFGILDALLGPKVKTRSVPYYDDTEQRNWLRRKSDIDNRYQQKKDEINAKSRILEEHKNQCAEELTYMKKMEPSRRKEIESMEKLLNVKIENITVQREKAKQEYLREYKQNIMDSVRGYLHETIEVLFIDNFEVAVLENKDRVMNIIHSLFELSFGERIKSLESLLFETNDTRQCEKTDHLLKILESTKLELEGYLCQQA